jgi:hypothetical protein
LTHLRDGSGGPVVQRQTEEALRSGRSPQHNVNTFGLVLGSSYASAAVVPDGTAPPDEADPVADYMPTARPGHRAPHLWLERAEERRATFDLFDMAFTLLGGPAGQCLVYGGRAGGS